MKEARSKAARAVFQGHMVVSGGRRDQHNVELKLNTVERYDVFADKWSLTPSMIKGKHGHSLVVVGNKLFAIKTTPGKHEVFDNTVNKFVMLKCPLIETFVFKAVSIGNKILMFQRSRPTMICYDVCKDEFTQTPFAITKNLCEYSLLNVPSF